MTMEECYTRLGADYADVLRRLGKEEWVKHFLCKLPEDESFPHLCKAMEMQSETEAFRAAHSLKGVCMNLGLTSMSRSVGMLTDELRKGVITAAAQSLYQQVAQEYRAALQVIEKLR